MCFQLIQSSLDLPPLVIKRCQFLGRRLLVTEYGGDQPIDRLGVFDVF